jgi:hypothetical protein
MEGLSLQDVN